MSLIRSSSASAPATPAANNITTYPKKLAGETTLAYINEFGAIFEMQSALFTKRWELQMANNTSSITNIGLASNTNGTLGTGTFANTNTLTQSTRVTYTSAATTASSAYTLGTATFYRTNGYKFIVRGGFSVQPSGCRLFMGAAASNLNISTGTDTSANTNLIGVGKDAADTNWFFMYNDASGAANKTDTGITISATTIYEVRVFASAGGSNVYISITDLSTGTTVEHTATTNQPATGTFLRWINWAGTANQATAVVLDHVKGYAETNI